MPYPGTEVFVGIPPNRVLRLGGCHRGHRYVSGPGARAVLNAAGANAKPLVVLKETALPSAFGPVVLRRILRLLRRHDQLAGVHLTKSR
jgi:hypothetical protein